MLSQGPKQEGEDWETEPLLSDHTRDAQLSANSVSQFARWKRAIKLGGLLTFGVALLTTAFVLVPHYFWSSFKRFGPAEPHDYTVSSQWRKSVACKDHAQWWQSEVIEYNRRWSSHTNLTVPLSKGGLSFLVKGNVYGSVDFVEDDALANEAYVEFYVEYDSRVMRKTQFCTWENGHDSGSGVGIFGPKYPGGRKATMARATVHLPKSAAPKMEKMFVVAPDMEVNFPSDFKIKSGILSVRSKKASLHATNVECESCDFNVSDGPISGNFTVRHELILKTKSGAIDANIIMISNSTNIHLGPTVDITTSTGPINVDFTLVAVEAETEKEVPDGGLYQIATRSRHAPVRLEVVDAPVDSTLVLSSKNMMGSLEIYLHPTYQGKFSSEAFVGGTPLGIRGYTTDPSGNGRKRNLVWDAHSIPPGIHHVLSGEVWWGDRPGPPYPNLPYIPTFGSVQAKSTIGNPLILFHLWNPNMTSVLTN